MQTLQQLLAGELTGAKSIKLSCGLTEVPTEILALADTLELLDLSGNAISALPEAFCQLKKLKILFLSDNSFTEYPTVLGKCANLEMIGFKANKIENIPEEALTSNIRWLIITNNCLTKLPVSIGKCTRLQKFMLAGNKLKTLPVELANCQNLELFRISANELTELPAWIFSLPRLSWLAFAGNPFSKNIPVKDNLPFIDWTDLNIKEILGQGASGIIVKADWQTSQKIKPVAVKVFKGEVTSDGVPADEMLACALAGIHPNIVPVLGKIAGHPEQKQGLVLELIPPDFRNLGNPPSYATCTRDTYLPGTHFTLSQVVTIATGIAHAAAHLHSKGIMHGDLYAHNILINDASNALFSDFGAATIYERANLQLAKFLERLEIRAFGYLLDDLLTHLNLEDHQPENIAILTNLKEACLQEKILERPDFATICNQLTHLTF